jgi:hypothetical protein
LADLDSTVMLNCLLAISSSRTCLPSGLVSHCHLAVEAGDSWAMMLTQGACACNDQVLGHGALQPAKIACHLIAVLGLGLKMDEV